VAIRLDDLLAPFGRLLRAAAKAPRTIELYGQSVEYFSRWLTDRRRPATLEELMRHAISAWLAELAETCEPSTVGTRLRGMRRFCRWLVTEGELEKAPTDGIEIPSPPDKPVPILTDDEIAARSRRARSGAGGPESSTAPSSSAAATRSCCDCCSTPACGCRSCAGSC
jgi:site-specific recombinase XerD